jgi:acetoin utilization deacetylase AcuC-like enzyme
VRAFAAERGVGLGAVLEGGYEPRALAECVVATLAAFDDGRQPVSVAPDPLLTSRAAAQIGHYWPL